METKKIDLKLFLEALAVVIVLEALMCGLLFGKEVDPSLLLGGGRVLEIGALILLFYFHSGGLARPGLNRSRFVPGVTRGLIWSLGFAALVMILFFGLYIFDFNPLGLIRMSLPEKTPDLLIFFLIGGLIGPVAEEIFFRGVLYGFFRRWGIITALLLSTAIFVLLHLPLNYLPVSQAVGGILFALAYEAEKNLYAPMVIHVLGNLAIFSLSLFL